MVSFRLCRVFHWVLVYSVRCCQKVTGYHGFQSKSGDALLATSRGWIEADAMSVFQARCSPSRAQTGLYLSSTLSLARLRIVYHCGYVTRQHHRHHKHSHRHDGEVLNPPPPRPRPRNLHGAPPPSPPYLGPHTWPP